MTSGVPLDHRLSLHDHVALDEIELYAEVLIAVADADRPLCPAEIDRVLGLEPASAAAADTAPRSRGDEPTRPPGPNGPTGPPSRAPGRGPDPEPSPPDDQENGAGSVPARDYAPLVPEPRSLIAPLPAPGLPWTPHPLTLEVPLPSAPPPPPALWAH
jgi:hypothetical protein